MMRFVLYGRKSKDSQNKDQVQHTFATQDWIIERYLESVGAEGVDYTIVERFAETKSGGGYYDKRPLFKRAVDMCKEDKGLTLLVAKAERLARNLRSGAELMETISFVLANAPDADDLQKQLEFMIAEREWKNTSQRWKDMYKAKKALCDKNDIPFQWGASADAYKINPSNVTSRNIEDSIKRIEHLEEVMTLIKDMLPKPTLNNIAKVMTERKYPLPSGKIGNWTPTQVNRVMDRLKIKRI